MDTDTSSIHGLLPETSAALCGIKCHFTVNKLGCLNRKLGQPQETGNLSFHPVSQGLEGSTAGCASAGTVTCSSQNNTLIRFVVIFHTMHATANQIHKFHLF